MIERISNKRSCLVFALENLAMFGPSGGFTGVLRALKALSILSIGSGRI